MLFEAFQPTCETHPVIVVIFMALRIAIQSSPPCVCDSYHIFIWQKSCQSQLL